MARNSRQQSAPIEIGTRATANIHMVVTFVNLVAKMREAQQAARNAPVNSQKKIDYWKRARELEQKVDFLLKPEESCRLFHDRDA